MTKLRQLLEKCVPEKQMCDADDVLHVKSQAYGHAMCRQTVLENLSTVEAELLKMIDGMKYTTEWDYEKSDYLYHIEKDGLKVAYNRALEDLKAKLLS